MSVVNSLCKVASENAIHSVLYTARPFGLTYRSIYCLIDLPAIVPAITSTSCSCLRNLIITRSLLSREQT